MVAMATLLLFPAWRINARIPRALIPMFADDRNAVATSGGQLENIDGAWSEAERASALKNNSSKCVRWTVWKRGAELSMQGRP
eukprot:13998146-Alexandrium_andersonii.AAC.1